MSVGALTSLTAFLKDEKINDDDLYVSKIKEVFSDEDDQKAFALRLVIHYTGDVHQPLHDTSAVDK